jgi:hypothetical protein
MHFVYRMILLVTLRARGQFRAEFFNFPNHANFGLPSYAIETAGAGQVTDADSGRQIQFGLKVSF